MHKRVGTLLGFLVVLVSLLLAAPAVAEDGDGAKPQGEATTVMVEPKPVEWDLLPRNEGAIVNAYPLPTPHRNVLPLIGSGILVFGGLVAILWGHGSKRKMAPRGSA